MDYEAKARSFILAFTHRTEIPAELEFLIPVMVKEDKNKDGSEGLSSKGVSGISENYIEGYSDSIMKILKRYRKIVVL